MSYAFTDHTINLRCFFCLCSPVQRQAAAKVVNGEIDLTGWDFEKDGPLNEGDWLFAWEKFVEPASWDDVKKEMVHTLPLPGQWRTLNDPAKPANKLPRTGYASYAVKINGVLTDQSLGILIGSFFSAAKSVSIMNDNQFIDQVSQGKIGQYKFEETPVSDTSLILKLGQPKDIYYSNYTIIINVSNHYSYRGGPRTAPVLNQQHDIDLIDNHRKQRQAVMRVY